MYRYILRRVALLLVIALCICFAVYTMMYRIPSSAVRGVAVDGSGDALDRFFEKHGAKNGFFSGYLRYAYNLFFKLDMGTSSVSGGPVWRDIKGRMLKTLTLAGGSILLTALLGPLLGIVAAVYHNTWKDHVLMAVTAIGASFPAYVLGVFALMLFAVKLGWVRVLDYSNLKQLMLPIIVLSVGGIASTARMMRSNMLEILGKEYIVTARAKGVQFQRVLFKHALKNAVPSVVTVLATQLVQLLGGSFVVENVFPMAGMGHYLIEAISRRNGNAIQGSIVVIGVMIAAIYMLSDIICAYVNPRIRERYTSGSRAGRRTEGSV